MLRNVRVVSNLRIIKVILKANVAHEKDSNAGNNLPSWIQEAPEEIDVLLAQRDFVQAQKILLKCEKTLATEHPKSSNDTKHQLVEKRKMIVEVLCAELSPAADRSLRAGPRGQRVPAQAEVSNNISNLCFKISQHSKIDKIVMSLPGVDILNSNLISNPEIPVLDQSGWPNRC